MILLECTESFHQYRPTISPFGGAQSVAGVTSNTEKEKSKNHSVHRTYIVAYVRFIADTNSYHSTAAQFFLPAQLELAKMCYLV